MSRIWFIGGLFAAAILLYGHQPAQAQSSGPSPFECPWTAVSGTSPSADGCYGGGNDGCGGDDSAPDIPCEEQTPKMTTSPAPTWDVSGAINQAKADLLAANPNEDLMGANCGKIVEQACNAGYFPADVGMLFKDYGNQYNNHSVDYVVDLNGMGWDVVVGCGGDGVDPTSGNTGGVGGSGCCGPYVNGDASDCQPLASGPMAGRYINCPP